MKSPPETKEFSPCRFSYSVEGESTELGPGDSIVVPPGLSHGTVCLEQGVLLDVFTPCSQDFLK